MSSADAVRIRWETSIVLGLGGTALLVLTAGLVLARRALDSYDSQIMFAVARSMATTRTAYVPPQADSYGLNTPHSSYGLGQSLAEVPAYLLAVHSGHDPQTLAMLVNPVLLAAIAVVVWLWARCASATPAQAAAVAVATCLGTILLAYVVTGGSEIGTALGVAVAILGVELAERRVAMGAIVAGAGVGIAVLWRPDSAILIGVPVAVAVLLRTRRRFPLFVLFVLATAPVAVVTLLYFGSSGGQYAGTPLSASFGHPLGAGLWGLLASPGRGVILYVPLFLPALAAVPWAWRRSALVTGLCVAVLAVRLPFYATWFAWNGGWAWGPRFLVPAMPCLAPLLYEFVRRLSPRRPGLSVAVCAVLAVSVSLQVVGAAVRYDTDTANLLMTAPHGPSDSVLFDWRYFPVWEHVRELRHGRNLTPGYRGRIGPS